MSVYFLYVLVLGSHVMPFAWLRCYRSDHSDKRWPYSCNSRAHTNDSEDFLKRKEFMNLPTHRMSFFPPFVHLLVLLYQGRGHLRSELMCLQNGI